MLRIRLPKQLLIKLGIILTGLIIIGIVIYLWKPDIFHSSYQTNQNKIDSSTPSSSSNTQQQTITAAFNQFAAYMKSATTNATNISLKDYKMQSIDKINTKNGEIHAIVLFSAEPLDAISQQNLLATGGELQNGWIVNKKVYITLIKKNNAYTIFSISFTPNNNF